MASNDSIRKCVKGRVCSSEVLFPCSEDVQDGICQIHLPEFRLSLYDICFLPWNILKTLKELARDLQ